MSIDLRTYIIYIIIEAVTWIRLCSKGFQTLLLSWLANLTDHVFCLLQFLFPLSSKMLISPVFCSGLTFHLLLPAWSHEPTPFKQQSVW